MMKLRRTLLAAALGAALSGCASLTPEMPVASPDIPAHWNQQAVETIEADQASVLTTWKEIVTDDALRHLITLALENNRDIRTSLLNIEKTKYRYHIQDAERAVQVTGNTAFERGRNGDQPVRDNWQAVGSVSYELDLFKRAESLSEAAWQAYIADTYQHDAARIALVARVSTTYLDFLASKRWRELAIDTWESREASYALSEQRHRLGQVSALSLSQERGLVDAASREVAMHGGNVVQTRQALETLVGTSLDGVSLDSDWGEVMTDHEAIGRDLSSATLLKRPDIQAAEASLAAANAQVGAARAALFPSLRLTGQTGVMSADFSDLISGSRLWGISPSLHLPIFDGGRLKAQEKVASIEQQQALLAYEDHLRLAFQEVADILTEMTSLKHQHEAQEKVLASAEKAYQLSKVRYEAGRDNYLALLDAERTRYAAQKEVISLDLARQKMQIMLYKALGGAVDSV